MTVFLAISTALSLCFVAIECVRVLQSANYNPFRGYFRVLLSTYYLWILFAQVCVAALHFTIGYDWLITVFVAPFSLLINFSEKKVPLKFTKRVVRLFVVTFVLQCCLCLFVPFIWWLAVLPITVVVANMLCLPVELAINNYYVQKARKKLQSYPITVIAVTGSYGKTTTKTMLAQMLTGAITSDNGYNTPLGIAKFINHTELYGYKYVVLEFGAKNVGDVRTLCRLYKPSVGVVTGVCPQHLSTFGSFANVIKTKRELVEGLPASGFCVINTADRSAAEFLTAGICKKVPIGKGISVQTLSRTLMGTTLAVGRRKNSANVTLPQFAEYISDTYKLCFTVCNCLKQPFEQTVANTQKIKQVPHRMQVTHNGIYHIVDDSYNADISGVESCCKALGNFDCTKVAIAQGIVECGECRKSLNVRTGELLGQTFHLTIVLGKNAKYLQQGLKNVGAKCVLAQNLRQAVQIANRYLSKNDILLFQNDLPDTINVT